LRHRLPAQVRDILIDHVERSLLDHLLRDPASAPYNPIGDQHDADARYLQCALYAAMAASATVAALESWLRGPDPLDQEWVVQSILLGIPEWWERSAPVTL
ncbi:MAG TPA: hypothetical protein VGP24_10895, partial [Glaciihabitans sp.]|nr:hypothetical protein [Glaciihabitans sp.]